MKHHNSKILLISTSDFNNDGRLQRLYSHVKKLNSELITVAYGENASGENMMLSPVPVRSLFARLLDVSKMLISRILPQKQLLKLLATRHITKDLYDNAFQSDQEKPFKFVIVKHWTSLPTALLLQGNPKIWLDINEVFEAEHDNSKLWQLIYKPVILRLLKIAGSSIILRSATSLKQIQYLKDDTILHLPNTKKPIEKTKVQPKENQTIKLLYHGLIAPNRSLETAIKALSQSGRNDLKLTIRGSGKPTYIARLKALADDLKLTSQVHFEPSIENSKLIQAASQYNIGLCLFGNHSQQLLLSEPNKIYEYMAAGLGIISSETPSIISMIGTQNVGEFTKISSEQVNELALVFQTLSHDKVFEWQKNSYLEASKTWQKNYDWKKLDLSLQQIQQELVHTPNKS